jgi:NAD(P)H dehydrogenase (quinone)
MSTLVITAHPDPTSLTHEVARRLTTALGPDESAVAHLAQEGFDPRFTASDRQNYLVQGGSDTAVRAEQERIDAVTDLVLVFPVYWWSMPALLKGWFDRVFIGGWAFDYDENQRVVPRLQRLTVHMVPISGTSAGSFERHGYSQSFRTQIESGILDFCGVTRGETEFIWDAEARDDAVVSRDVDHAVASVAAAISGVPLFERADSAGASEESGLRVP